MTIFSNDPIRVKISLKEIWETLTHPAGIDSTFYPTNQEHKDEYFLKLTASDINPHNPTEEKYKDDIDNELAKFNILQDHIREFKPYTYFNNDTNSSKIIETIIDEKVFSKENRYDLLLDRYSKNWHYLEDGHTKFGMIEGLPCNNLRTRERE